MEMTPRERRRWNAKVVADGECLYWTGYKNAKGYGAFSFRGKPRAVHRLAYEIAHGEIPDGYIVRHVCPGQHNERTRSCVNPAHLVVGTDADNTADRREHGTISINTGEDNARSKLTWEIVREIRRRLADGETGAALGREYGVTKEMISSVKRGKSWIEDGVVVQPKSAPRGSYKKPPRMRPDARDLEHFWAKVDKTGDCWLWTAATDPTGYGRFSCERVWPAHQFAYYLVNGAIPDGLDIAHSCANRLCVNPAHLTATTRSENMANPDTRERISSANKGNRNHTSLSDGQICLIKEWVRDEPDVQNTEIARRLGDIVTPEGIAPYRKGERGGHAVVPGFVPQTEKRIGGAKGEKSGRAKLTAEDVREIRRRHADGERAVDLAVVYGVCRRNLDDIVKGRTWKTV